MPRIVSVWLKSWPIARFLRAQDRAGSLAPSERIDPGRPFVLVLPQPGGARLVALNRAARAEGLVRGEQLARARVKLRDLQARPAEPAADDAALERLAWWSLRYTPLVAPWSAAEGADGLFLDITGCAHLFGGEAALLDDLARRLRGFGLSPKLALADTVGAAWAVARYGPEPNAILPAGAEAEALRALPLAALRLEAEARETLARLGFRRIGELLDQPRPPFARRFGAGLLRRLDQALGRLKEPLCPLLPPPAYAAQTAFFEPITATPQLLDAARHLLGKLIAGLARDQTGLRRLRLTLFRADGEVASVELELAAPVRDAPHVLRLLELRLDRLASERDGAVGFDAIGLAVTLAERLPERQGGLLGADADAQSAGLARLIDTLDEKLGAGSVRRLLPHASHLPERAIRAQRAADTTPATADAPPLAARPLLLFAPTEEAEVLALVPDGPPRQFRWRGGLHQVAEAEGPERIAAEWWRDANALPDRDYYLVEDTLGRRFWLYRAGPYGAAGAPPRWFVHGIFP